MKNKSNKKRIISKKSIIFRLLFIVIYSIILYYLYTFFIDLGIDHFIIIIIFIFLILIVIGPLITGISKSLYYRMFPRNRKSIKKKDYRSYKEQLKTAHQGSQIQHTDTTDINLEFKYRKPIIRKCNHCGIVVPNFVKTCPNCGKPILD